MAEINTINTYGSGRGSFSLTGVNRDASFGASAPERVDIASAVQQRTVPPPTMDIVQILGSATGRTKASMVTMSDLTPPSPPPGSSTGSYKGTSSLIDSRVQRAMRTLDIDITVGGPNGVGALQNSPLLKAPVQKVKGPAYEPPKQAQFSFSGNGATGAANRVAALNAYQQRAPKVGFTGGDAPYKPIGQKQLGTEPRIGNVDKKEAEPPVKILGGKQLGAEAAKQPAEEPATLGAKGLGQDNSAGGVQGFGMGFGSASPEQAARPVETRTSPPVRNPQAATYAKPAARQPAAGNVNLKA